MQRVWLSDSSTLAAKERIGGQQNEGGVMNPSIMGVEKEFTL